MDKKTKTILYIALFAIFLAAASYGYKYLSARYNAGNQLSPSPSATASLEGAPDNSPGNVAGDDVVVLKEKVKAPDFTVLDYDGKEVKLSDFIGTPIVLNFWASWCPPCKAEMPHFNKVSEEYAKDKLLFLMVDLAEGQRETVESGKKFIEDNQYTFTVLFDTKQDAAAQYGIRAIPTTYFIDKDGNIVAGKQGGMEEDALRKAIKLISP